MNDSKQDNNFFKKGFGKLKVMLQTKEQKALTELKEN